MSANRKVAASPEIPNAWSVLPGFRPGTEEGQEEGREKEEKRSVKDGDGPTRGLYRTGFCGEEDCSNTQLFCKIFSPDAKYRIE